MLFQFCCWCSILPRKKKFIIGSQKPKVSGIGATGFLVSTMSDSITRDQTIFEHLKINTCKPFYIFHPLASIKLSSPLLKAFDHKLQLIVDALQFQHVSEKNFSFEKLVCLNMGKSFFSKIRKYFPQIYSKNLFKKKAYTQKYFYSPNNKT